MDRGRSVLSAFCGLISFGVVDSVALRKKHMGFPEYDQDEFFSPDLENTNGGCNNLQ